jgi:hypothetical protein
LPNITPIFWRNWLVKIMQVLLDLMTPVSLRSAWLIKRACKPTWLSPISPSISARGTKRRHAVDDDDIHCIGTHQRLGDLQRLLAGVRLADVEVVDVDADLGGVGGVERVLHIHKAADAAQPLRLGDHMQAERRLAGTFRAVDLHHAPARKAADAQRNVQAQAAAGNGFDVELGGIAQLHHHTFAVLLVQVGQRRFERLALAAVQYRLAPGNGDSVLHVGKYSTNVLCLSILNDIAGLFQDGGADSCGVAPVNQFTGADSRSPLKWTDSAGALSRLEPTFAFQPRFHSGVFKIDNPEVRLLREVELRCSGGVPST